MPTARVVRVSAHVTSSGRAYVAVVARTWQGAYWSDRRLIGFPLEGQFEVSDQAAILRAAAAALEGVADRLQRSPGASRPAPPGGPRGASGG